MKKDIYKKIRMIAAVSEALSFKKGNSDADNEKALRHISKFVSSERDEETKIGMIASASRALSIQERSPAL